MAARRLVISQVNADAPEVRQCLACRREWPCDVVMVLAALDEHRTAMATVARHDGFWLCWEEDCACELCEGTAWGFHCQDGRALTSMWFLVSPFAAFLLGLLLL